MKQQFDRKAIGARASAIYRGAKSSGVPLTWADAQRRAWAEAKGSHTALVISGKPRSVAYIDGAQPGGVAAAMARYGINVEAISERAALFVQHLSEVLHTAAMRRQANVAALRDDRGVINAVRAGNEWRA